MLRSLYGWFQYVRDLFGCEWKIVGHARHVYPDYLQLSNCTVAAESDLAGNTEEDHFRLLMAANHCEYSPIIAVFVRIHAYTCTYTYINMYTYECSF